MTTTLYLKIKEWLASAVGLHIYRKGTPLGLDLVNDLRVIIPTFTPHIVLDVGANVGQTALRFQKLWPKARVYCFEPVKSTYSVLQQNVSTLGPNVKTYHLALSDQAGEASIFLSTQSVLATLERPQFSLGSLSGVEETVYLDTLDGWCAKNQVEEIDLLKIDTEGHDLKVLEGGRAMFAARRVRTVFVEAHLCGSALNLFLEISRWLEAWDFQLVGFHDQHLWISQKLFFGNLLYVHRGLLKN